MAMQQVVPLMILLQGDGVSTVFKYRLLDMFAFAFDINAAGAISAIIVNNRATPSRIDVISGQNDGGAVQASLSSNGTLTLQFESAPSPISDGNGATMRIRLYFDSQ